jgi:hypothetical protein
VGPRTGLDTVVKREISSPCRDSNPTIIQPVKKVKLSLGLAKHHVVKTYGEVEVQPHAFLTPVIFTSRSLYPRKKEPPVSIE